jgi:tRNA A-37 threonylcarbamoyl transferase component Bud32
MQCHTCQAVLPPDARFCLSCGARVEPSALAPPADPLRDALGKAIGFQYRIERLLGRGGMGAVYLAHELALDRDVAIKVLPPEQASTPELRERFKREARTAARLTHPNIVPLHTFGEVSGLLYFVMGYVAGESLAARLQRQGPLDSEAARMLLVSVCDALDYAHRQGVVHRDIKPDNILIDDSTGAPLLTDFGIAKAALADAQLTTPGQLIGTPHYMSPEQAAGMDVGPRSDLYSLGAVAYEIVSGHRPFDAVTPMDALTQRLTREPRPLSSVAGHVAPDLAQAIGRCLAREPANRWPDAKSLREALLPSEEETENTFEERLLRISTSVILLAMLVSTHAAVYWLIDPTARAPRRLVGGLMGAMLPMTIMTLVALVRIHRQGVDIGSALRRVFQHPNWWRGWYPRRLRRPTDVWDRLPGAVRLFRAYRGALLIYVVALFIPIQLVALIGGGAPALRNGLLPILLPLIAGVFAIRRRAIALIRNRTGVTDVDASRLLNTPTWRTSVWRRPPAASLLDAPTTTTPLPAESSAQDDTATRLT